MGWLFVSLASVSELIGVMGLSLFCKERTIRNGIIYLGGLSASFLLIYTSFQYLPASIAYTVWTGFGTAGAVILNMIFFNEPKNLTRILSLAAIITGVVGLKMMS